MDFKQINDRALEIREKYAIFEKAKCGREWTKEEIALALVGDVGDLMKFVSAKSGIRTIEDVDNKLSHELADCFYTIIILAHKYNINLEESFLKTMDQLQERIEKDSISRP